MAINLDNINGVWICHLCKLEVSLVNDFDNNKLIIIYHDSHYSKDGIDVAKVQKSHDLLNISCRVGIYTVIFDGLDTLIFQALTNDNKSFKFVRIKD